MHFRTVCYMHFGIIIVKLQSSSGKNKCTYLYEIHPACGYNIKQCEKCK